MSIQLFIIGNFDSYFYSPATGKTDIPMNIWYLYMYTHEVETFPMINERGHGRKPVVGSSKNCLYISHYHKVKLQLSPREMHWQTYSAHYFTPPLAFPVHYIRSYFHVFSM